MKFKIGDFVWFYSDMKGNYDMDHIPNTEIEKALDKCWGGEVQSISIDKENRIAYDIQTYMMYSPYVAFSKMPEERLFASKKELKEGYISNKLREISEKRKELDELEKILKGIKTDDD